MGLRINNNIAALTAQRYLGKNNDAMTVSLERLSSGMRINRAADNPAGLVTSEKQRAQIAGLNQAMENTERGVSMIQTAEAALTEINSLLTKIRGLALDSANTAVNDADSLAANQAEIDDALASIDRIATTAQFGSKKLLDGSNKNTITVTDGVNGMDLSFDNSTLATGTDTATISGFAAASYTVQNASTVGIDDTPAAYGLVGVAAGDHTVEVTQASNYATLTGTVDITNSGITLAAADTMALTVSGTTETITMAGGGAAIADWVTAINIAINASTNFSTTVSAGKKLVTASAGTGNTIVFKTGNATDTAFDEGGTAAVTVGAVVIADGANPDKGASDIGFGSGNTSASGTNAIVEFDGYANTISFTNGNGTTASTINDASGNAVSITPAATGLNVGTAILTVAAATGNIGLSGGTAVAFTAGSAVTVTDANGETVDITVGEDITAGGSEGVTAVNNALVFQIGANNNQTVSIGIDDVGSDELATSVTNTSGFTDLGEIDVTTAQGSQDTLLLVDAAITTIANIRSELGSFQSNTLESNLNNLTVAAENMTAAESVLRDTDFAAEMAEFTKNQILVQAGMTVLANAAQMPQSVLTLLR